VTRVTAIETCVLEVPSAHQMALQYPLHRYVVAQVHTDEGIDGLGYSLLFNGLGDGPVYDCVQLLVPTLIGRDPAHIDEVWQAMYATQVSPELRRPLAYAISALDIALWDIAGKVAGLPLARLWGAPSLTVDCYGSGGWAPYTVTDLIAEAERYAGLGCAYYKLKAHDPGPFVNRARVEAVATALGSDVRLMVDLNQRGTVESNRELAAALAGLDVFWYEEPVPADDFAACAEVAHSIDIAVATGENNLTVAEFAELIERQAARYLMPDVCRAHGFTETLRIGALAAAASVQVAPHLVPELSAHVVAALPTGFLVEFMDWAPPDLFVDPPRCVGGQLTVSDRPGHGVALVSTAIEKYRVK
jgi:L-alanine-DL-glutamate epimerase-like enolase superfamily enzyme